MHGKRIGEPSEVARKVRPSYAGVGDDPVRLGGRVLALRALLAHALGLLHPVVLSPKYELIAGSRRVEAFKKLGRDSIPFVTVKGLNDATAILVAERDENTCRLDFTPSEAVEIGRALEELERPKAKERQKLSEGRGQKRSGNLPDLNQGDTRDKVGKAVGMSGATYQRAKAVVKAAEDDPEKFGPIAEEMDRTGNIQPAHDKVMAIKKGNKPGKKRKQLEAKDFEIYSGDDEPLAIRLSRLIRVLEEAEELCSSEYKELVFARTTLGALLGKLATLREGSDSE